jgi:hypothetical protein
LELLELARFLLLVVVAPWAVFKVVLVLEDTFIEQVILFQVVLKILL